jgi:putative peptidoglycan lipid II flippase
MKETDNLERNMRTNWSLTLVSRVTGLVRDGALSRLFGTSALASAFYFAFLIPNLFRRLFGEGALSAAFLPAYAKLHQKDPQVAKALASLTISKLIMFLGVVVVICELVLWLIISQQTTPSQSLQLTMVMLPYMPLVCTVAIFAAMLHVHDRFGPPAAAPIILNGLMIAAAFGFVHVFDNSIHHLMMVGVAVVVAGVIQVIWSLYALRRVGWITKDTTAGRGELRAMLRRTIPMALALGTVQINILFDGLIASWPTVFGPSFFGLEYPLSEGAMSSLSWAQRLYQFPLGVFGIAVATAIYPLLAKQAKDGAGFTTTIHRGLRLVVFIGLPASAGLILVRNPLATAVFQGGSFTSSDALVVGSILLGYAPAVWAYSMLHVLTKAFYAKDDAMTPVKVATLVVVLNFLLNITLIWTPLGTSALAWSTAICAVLQVSILMVLIRRHVAKPVDEAVVRSWLSTTVLTLIMGAVVAMVMNYMWVEDGEWLDSIYCLAACVASGSLTFLLGSVVMRMPELHWFMGRKT